MVELSAYGPAAMALALFALMGLVLGAAAGAAGVRAGCVSGDVPPADYSSRDYRIARAHLNLTENAGLFASVLLAAIVAGVAPILVNWVAWLIALTRAGMVAVHVGGQGKPSGGPRSLLFAAGAFLMMGLGLIAIVAVIV
ncbi:MAG: MAPEG family protein [Pseudomonadota bacterium]